MTAAGLGGGSMCALLRLRPSRHPGRGARVLQISQSDAPAAGAGAADLSPALIAVLKAVLTAGLYPNVACVSSPREAAPGETRQPCTAQTPQGGVQAHQASVNRFYPGPGWLVYHEKVPNPNPLGGCRPTPPTCPPGLCKPLLPRPGLAGLPREGT